MDVQQLEQLGTCASALLQWFTSTGVAHDRTTLTTLGSGHLELDLLNSTCRYRGEDLRPLAALPLLRARLENELAPLRLRVEDLRTCLLAADLWFGERHDSPSLMTMDGPRAMVTCIAFTNCVIQLGDYRVAADWADQLEWPAERAA